MYRFKMINSSVRPGRKGPPVTEWIANISGKDPNFQTEILDLAVINLPLMEEPNPPALKTYSKEHTLQWTAKIDAAEAFIFVTAEYNHSYPAPLVRLWRQITGEIKGGRLPRFNHFPLLKFLTTTCFAGQT